MAKNRCVLILLFISAITFFSSKAQAVSISPWVEYSNLHMTEVNDNLNTEKQIFELFGSTVNFNECKNGLVIGADIGIFRFGYMLPASAKYSTTILGVEMGKERKNSFIMALIGSRFPDSPESNLHFGLYAGYGHVMTDETRTGPFYMGGSVTIPYEGGDFIGQITAGIKLGMFELAAGYKYAFIKQVTATKDVDTNGDGNPEIKKGDPSLNLNGNPMPYDFGGIMFQVGMRFGPGSDSGME